MSRLSCWCCKWPE